MSRKIDQFKIIVVIVPTAKYHRKAVFVGTRIDPFVRGNNAQDILAAGFLFGRQVPTLGNRFFQAFFAIQITVFVKILIILIVDDAIVGIQLEFSRR